MVAIGHLINFPITYKSKKSNFKISKNEWNQKDAPEDVTKNLFSTPKMQITANF